VDDISERLGFLAKDIGNNARDTDLYGLDTDFWAFTMQQKYP